MSRNNLSAMSNSDRQSDFPLESSDKHASGITGFWQRIGEGFSSGVKDLWNQITGKTSRDFSHSEAELAYQRQRELTKDQYSLQVEGMQQAGLNPAFNGNSGTVPSVSQAGSASPGITLGDLSSMMANYLSARKLHSEIDNIEADTEGKKAGTILTKANVENVQAATGLTKEQSKAVIQSVLNAQKQIEVYQSEISKNKAQEFLLGKQAEGQDIASEKTRTEIDVMKQGLERGELDLEQIRYFNKNILPLTSRQFQAKLQIDERTADKISRETEKIIQDLVIQSPNVVATIEHIQTIIDTLGAKKTSEYFEALYDEIDSKIRYNRKKHHPGAEGEDGEPNDESGLYEFVVTTVTTLIEDLGSAISQGLGIRNLLKK